MSSPRSKDRGRSDGVGDGRLAFNGINATTGRPLVPPLAPEEVARLARGEAWNKAHLADLVYRVEQLKKDKLEVMHGVESKRLEEAGWGVVFPRGAGQEIRRALAPLLEHRRSQAARKNEMLYRELTYRRPESKPRFLARYKVGPGPVNPIQLPYYLLLVGSPEEIPFDFQYQLDVQYAVGRVHFETVEDYAAYARSVVAAEMRPPKRERRMALFGVANADDPATERSLRNLVKPLAEDLEASWGIGDEALRWEVETTLAEEATKDHLARLLGGDATPSLLLTASHGLGFDEGDPRQLPHQGALLCQDWPGPEAWTERIPEDHYFSADDVGEAADLSGLISFHFACYGAGTPEFDDYALCGSPRRPIAPKSFVASLPRRLLSHPRGGALAVVGHIDQVWSYSFDWPYADRQASVFTSTFGRLFEGYRIGAAMEFFNQRYAELSADLNREITRSRYGQAPDLIGLPEMWTASNDARSYVVLGDPAVRLAGHGVTGFSS